MSYANRVEDIVASVATGGLGDVTLAGTPPTLRRGLSGLGGVGVTFDYAIEQGAAWEQGRGTVTGTNTFSRVPTDSSASGAAVAFSAGARFFHAVNATTLSQVVSVLSIPFATAIPLTEPGQRFMPQQNVTGALAFTPAASAVRGALVYLRLVANGANTPTFGGFTEHGSSLGYDNRSGIVNVLQFFHDGNETWYSASQAANAVPIDTTAPTASSAAVANATPSTVAITMSEALDAAYVPAASAFTVSGHTVLSAAISGSVINLSVSPAFVNGEAASTVAYTQPGTNNARDAAGNLLANFSGLAITNNVQPADTTAPTFSSAQVANASPSVIQITMNETLANSVPATSAFAVSGGKTVSGVSIAGAVVSVTVSSAYVNGDVITVSYTQPGANPRLQDAAGNATASFGPSAVTNNVAAAGDTTAPTLSSPTGAQTGSTTASGSVSTDEANGTLYRYVSVNATESAATVKAANLTTAVIATGVQNVSYTGLTASTTYYAHYVHRDAAGNDSTVASSASFTTTAPATDYPRLTGLSATTIESGSGPYTYTGNGGTLAAETGGISSRSLPANADGWLEFVITTPNEIIVSWRHLSTTTIYSNTRFGLYAPGASGSLPTSYRRVGTLVTAGPNAAGLAPQTGDRLRLARVGNILKTQLARAATPTTFVDLDTVDAGSAPQMWIMGYAYNTAAIRLEAWSGFV